MSADPNYPPSGVDNQTSADSPMQAPTPQPAGPQAELAAWQAEMEDAFQKFYSIAFSGEQGDRGNAADQVARIRELFRAMPQPQPDAELLRALKDLLDTSPYQPASHRATVRAREVVAQHETGAAPPALDKLCVFCKKPMGDESAPPNAAFGLHRGCK